ncbi:MAG: hypothetical protein Kow0096_08430 [Thiohalomonadaceae bacterium]
MEVFVGNLPKTVKVGDIERLLAPFDRQVQIKLQQHNRKNGEIGCHAVCTFSSDRLAQKAIKKLNGSQLFGLVLNVREYRYRSYSNERRALGWRNRPWQGMERRGAERRQGSVKAAEPDPFAEAAPEEKERIVIQGYRDLATKTT